MAEPDGLRLAAVAQPRGYAVDGQLDTAQDFRVDHALPVQSEQLHVDVIERVEIGNAVLNGALEQGVGLQQSLAAGNALHGDDGHPLLFSLSAYMGNVLVFLGRHL